MYDELVKRLRRDATAFVGFVGEDLRQAADAIEERCQQVDKFAEEAARLYAKQPRWIPVSERLPEEKGYYLCILKSFFGNWRFTDVCQYDGGYFTQNGIVKERITHWMPLPQPPEEE